MGARRLVACGLAAVFALLGLWCAPVAVRAGQAHTPPAVDAEAYVVMDAATGQVLVEKNAHRLEYPASITKVMTLALALETLGVNTDRWAPVEVSEAAVDALIPRASMIALGRGEVASLNDLLYATKIESANDAAHALAEYVSGSMDAFAAAMTEKARGLGLSGSNFTNASGQPDDAHYTTAYDMAAITRWALSVPGFRELFSATRYSMPPTNLQPGGREFHNANLALVPHSRYYCEGVTGSKTGYTDQARYTLVTTAQRGDTELICVVMNCPFNESKYLDTNALLDHCFSSFRRVTYNPGDRVDCTLPVYGGSDAPLGEIQVFSEGSVSFLLHNSLDESVVVAEAEVPERYVIGTPFAPCVRLALPSGLPQQPGGELATLPLSWTGLEAVLAANTAGPQQHGAGGLAQMAEEQPVFFWLLVSAAAALVALAIALPLLIRRHRRNRLRKKRLAAVRAQLPVRIAPRPQPPGRGSAGRIYVDFRRPAASAALRAVNFGGPATAPHRAGRLR